MNSPIRVLFLATHRLDRAPNQRFRFEQYLQFLNQNGIQTEVSTLLSQEDDRLLYGSGNYLKKALLLWKQHRIRRSEMRRESEFDVIFIVREAVMTRSIAIEKAWKNLGKKIIYDFDDAIWKNDTSAANRWFSWVKKPTKINDIMRIADLVIAGNNYLADYAKPFNAFVRVIPTTIDTVEYQRQDHRMGDVITIGWSGSLTTIKHFELAIPFLTQLKAKYGNRIIIRVIGDEHYRHEGLGIQGQAWSKANEIRDLSRFDIGIMPLQDDEWSRGKCGLKGLQYMALGIPTLMSPVGVNTSIIQHGVNGFLPVNSEDWVNQISLLIEQSDLRTRIGKAAQTTVEQYYSVHSQQQAYLEAIRSVMV